jgi:hypothetical protein
MPDIYYKNLDKNSLIVYCDKDKYKDHMKKIDAHWNGTSWIVDRKKEKEVKKLISTLKIEDLSNHAKSRKEQNKYHRAVSESEDSEDEDYNEDEIELDSKLVEIINKTKEEKDCDDSNSDSSSSSSDSSSDDSSSDEEEKRKVELERKERFKKEENKKKKYLKQDDMVYLKSFKNKPSDFKKINNYISSEEELSSSSEESESSDDSFPEPRTPKKRKKYNVDQSRHESYSDLSHEVKELQRKMYKIELENKKLKSKI